MAYIFSGKKQILKSWDLNLEANYGSVANEAVALFKLHFEQPATGSIFVNGKKVIVFEDDKEIWCSCPMKKGPFTARVTVSQPALLRAVESLNGTSWGPDSEDDTGRAPMEDRASAAAGSKERALSDPTAQPVGSSLSSFGTSKGSNLESSLVGQCWEQIKVIYGHTGQFNPSDRAHAGVVRELVDQIDYYPHTVTKYSYHNTLEQTIGQRPPFKSVDELYYDLRKKAEMVVFWTCNPAFGLVYGFENYKPGDRLLIAILDTESDTIGAGMHQHRTLGADLSVQGAIFPRPFDIVGVFFNSTDDDIHALKGNLASKDAYVRRVSAWGLCLMRDREKVLRVAAPELKRLAADPDPDTREYAGRVS